MIERALTLAALILIGALILAPGAVAAPAADSSESSTARPQTSLAEIEDEVMCPVCGTLLGLSDAPQAERQRVLIRKLIDEGKSKEEIKDELVEEFGPAVLALPEGSGFNLAAYLVPIGGFLAAAVILFLAVRRWRRETLAAESLAGDPEDPERPPGASLNGMAPDDERQLDADLARYDL